MKNDSCAVRNGPAGSQSTSYMQSSVLFGWGSPAANVQFSIGPHASVDDMIACGWVVGWLGGCQVYRTRSILTIQRNISVLDLHLAQQCRQTYIQKLTLEL